LNYNLFFICHKAVHIYVLKTYTPCWRGGLFCFIAIYTAKLCTIIEWNGVAHRLGLQQFVAFVT